MLDWLKEILGDTYTEDIDKKVSEEIGKQFVSRTDFNTLNETKKTLENTVDTLKQQNGDNEALQKTIKDHEDTIAQLKKDAENTKKYHSLADELRTKGVVDPDYIIYKHGGVDKFTFDKEGKPENLDDVVKPYKENAAMAHIFSASKQDYNPAGGGNPVNNPFAKDTFNLTEQGRLLRENPAAAKAMAEAAGVKI